jgi:hypothetical protein
VDFCCSGGLHAKSPHAFDIHVPTNTLCAWQFHLAGCRPGQSHQLLTPEVGWAATTNKLFWTTDNGNQWKEITPKAQAPREISSVFFLDRSNGWALLSYAGKEDETTGVRETLFELASTQDGGDDWKINSLRVPDPEPSRRLSGEAWLDFVDPMHGWLMTRMNGNMAVSIGILRATDDGGKTGNRWPFLRRVRSDLSVR